MCQLFLIKSTILNISYQNPYQYFLQVTNSCNHAVIACKQIDVGGVLSRANFRLWFRLTCFGINKGPFNQYIETFMRMYDVSSTPESLHSSIF